MCKAGPGPTWHRPCSLAAPTAIEADLPADAQGTAQRCLSDRHVPGLSSQGHLCQLCCSGELTLPSLQQVLALPASVLHQAVQPDGVLASQPTLSIVHLQALVSLPQDYVDWLSAETLDAEQVRHMTMNSFAS